MLYLDSAELSQCFDQGIVIPRITDSKSYEITPLDGFLSAAILNQDAVVCEQLLSEFTRGMGRQNFAHEVICLAREGTQVRNGLEVFDKTLPFVHELPAGEQYHAYGEYATCSDVGS